MSEEKQGHWFANISKAVGKLATSDLAMDRSFEQLKKFKECCEEAVAGAMEGQSLLELEIAKNTENAMQWEAHARLAVADNNEELAIEALRRKYSFVQSSKEYESRLPLMRQRRLHLNARFTAVNVVIHRLSVLKSLFESLPEQSTLRDNLIAAIKDFVNNLSAFASASEEQSFNMTLVIVEQRIHELEQQLAGCAIAHMKENPNGTQKLESEIADLRASTQKIIWKFEKDLEVQRSIEAQRIQEQNEDGVWEARQNAWANEKALEALHECLRCLQGILIEPFAE